ncbi:Ribonuclease HII [Roseivivax jejudonensis]|uniref:Ribonuclease HII n=1 Tax=Roseivivax jejudonensis TaxID=1529041 RepID=A0A1X7A1Z3_9RHOB|nr:ribonuclease HII [Roseivivax jejudonensis]SLN67787.1 Ribonuclease HII [Roseivivax jejudonensis]
MDEHHERALVAAGLGPVAGVDEVGRGPLAGPVVAAAVIWDPAALPDGLRDSKTLSALRREALAEILLARCETGVGMASVEEIDRINILRASHLAMVRALAALPRRPGHALIDGRHVPLPCPVPATPLIRGDARAVSVAAASVLAKVVRDALMRDLAQHFPGYGWETNMGYPSKRHRTALRDLGVTPHHRRSFRPVRNILYQDDLPSG